MSLRHRYCWRLRDNCARDERKGAAQLGGGIVTTDDSNGRSSSAAWIAGFVAVIALVVVAGLIAATNPAIHAAELELSLIHISEPTRPY